MKKYVRLEKELYEIVEETDDEVCVLAPFEFWQEGVKMLRLWWNKSKLDIEYH